MAAAEAARVSGNAPNTVMAAAVSIVGPARAQRARQAAQTLIELFSRARLADALDEKFDVKAVAADARSRELFVAERRDAKAEAMLTALERRGAKSVFVRYLRSLGGHPTSDAVLAAITTTAAWAPLSAQANFADDRLSPAVVDAAARHHARKLGTGRAP